MKARILTTLTMTAGLAAILPAKAADLQLLNLVMPDAKVVAGVNVEQAKGTQFGQYLLSLAQNHDPSMQELIDMTGFDPTRDVREVLVASVGTARSSGLVLSRGTFDVARITAAATQKKAISELYKGVTILEEPKGKSGLAFIDSTTVVAGELADVKAAVDRVTSPSVLPAALMVEINRWSTSEDAWAISKIGTANVKIPAGTGMPALGNLPVQSLQSGAAGVKLGPLVVVKAEAQADTAQNAEALGNVLKLLASMAAMQNNVDPVAKQLVQSLAVTTQGSTLSLQASLPQDQLQQIVQPRPAPTATPTPRRVPRNR